MLELPTVPPPAGYVTKNLYLRMSHKQAEKLKSLKYGLMAKETRLSNGVVVTKEIHAIAWILEQI